MSLRSMSDSSSFAVCRRSKNATNPSCEGTAKKDIWQLHLNGAVDQFFFDKMELLSSRTSRSATI